MTHQPNINYENVTISRDNYIVLQNINFVANPGQLIYLVGKVGSGKSSLLRTLYAEIPTEQGQACILDYDLSKIKRRYIPRLRRRIGIVFQDFKLLGDRSVYDNLDFVLRATGWTSKAERKQRIEEVLETVGLKNKDYKMPHQLSGGEQQRVVIARAILNDPDIILADEPTGNLDPETATHVFSLLGDLATKGKTVIVSTHNHSLIDRFPGQVYLCEDKKLCRLP